MDLGLDGKVAWVLGGSSGLGRACAVSLAAEGARVAISARGPERLEETANEIRASGAECVPVPLDVSEAEAIGRAHEQVVDSLGDIDILIANAGGPPPGPFESFDDAALQDAVQLTLASAWRLTKAVTPGMKGRGGAIVYITSGSVKEPISGLLFSNMLRPAIVGMAKTLSKELAPDGIRVLCVAPGRVRTPRVDALDEVVATNSGRPVDEVRAASEASIPLGRYGRPEEFGDVVAFLASERASYMTGVTVVVDGGHLHSLLA